MEDCFVSGKKCDSCRNVCKMIESNGYLQIFILISSAYIVKVPIVNHRQEEEEETKSHSLHPFKSFGQR